MGWLALRIDLFTHNAPVRHPQYPLRHAGNVGVVGNDDGGGAEFGIDALQRFQHPHAGGRIKGTRRFVAEHDDRPLGNGARNSHALLLAARELRRENDPAARPAPPFPAHPAAAAGWVQYR